MKKFVFLLVTAALLFGCKDDTIRIEDFIKNEWILTGYERNNTDETNLIQISDYKESYITGNVYNRSYVSGKGINVTESGRFEINETNSSIHLSDISSIDDFSEHHSTLSSSTIYIEEISANKLVYSYENGGDLHRFQFESE